ncbi:hypothetical protein ACLK1T_13730 [Escherichia coli]
MGALAGQLPKISRWKSLLDIRSLASVATAIWRSLRSSVKGIFRCADFSVSCVDPFIPRRRSGAKRHNHRIRLWL